jgi:hypothetical protein
MVVEPVRKWIPSYNVPCFKDYGRIIQRKLEESLNY